MKKAILRDVFGFSIIELLIATMLALLLVTAILNVTLQGSRLSQQLRLRSELLETGRYLINSMDYEISHAGYYGPLDLAKITGSVRADLCSGIDTSAIQNTLNFPVDGLDNLALNDKVCNGDRALLGSDVLLIRHADKTPMTPDQPLIGKQHYIQALGDQYIIDRGANAAAFSLKQKDNSTLAEIRPWQQAIYYVSKNHVLKRRRLLGGKYSPSEPLAEGVDDFQIMYGIARPTGNRGATSGQAVDFVSLPATVDEWRNIVAIKYYFLLSSTENFTALVGDKIYHYGDKSAVTFDDNKKRSLFSGYTRLRNNVPNQ